MITKDNFKGINFKQIHKRNKELLHLDFIPILIYPYIENKQERWEYLKKQGLYEKGLKEKAKQRQNLKKSEDKLDYQFTELVNWINKYPKFIDLIDIQN